MKELLRLPDAPLELEVGWRITDPGTWHLLPSRGIKYAGLWPEVRVLGALVSSG
jgi:hypothetical protein